MSNWQYVNQGVSNYENRVRNTLSNPVQRSEAKPPKFDIHDRLMYGSTRDRLYIARLREQQRKGNVECADVPVEVENEVQTEGETEGESQNVEKEVEVQNVPAQSPPPQVNMKEIMDMIYPVGTIYTRNINELPFDFGKWELMDEYIEEEEEHAIHKWVRIF